MSEKEITGNICAVCGIKAGLKCTGCLAVIYCGKEHQIQDWKKGHKNACKSYEVRYFIDVRSNNRTQKI